MNTPSPARFDSPLWREARNAKLREWLQDDAAVECVLAMFNIAEVWDDLADGDTPARDEAMKAWRDALFGLEHNPFYAAHRPLLVFFVEQLSLMWETANALEMSGDTLARERAYFLRDSPTMLVPTVAAMLRGYEYALKVSAEVWAFFPHEGLDKWEYKDERRRK